MSQHRRLGFVCHALFASLALFVLVVTIQYGRNRNFGTDFWEHAAVVRAMMRDPWHPAHPFLVVDAPHAFFSPYALAVALFARAAGVDAISALVWAGGINLLVFLSGLFVLVRVCARVDGSRNLPLSLSLSLSPLLALALCLFLWGEGAWDWSGFFHLGALVHAGPYPSTLSGGLALWGLAIGLGVRPDHRHGLVLICAISVFLLITHPTTAVVFALGVAAVFLAQAPRNLRALLAEAVPWAAAGLVAFALAAWWPYFPVLELAWREGAGFHRDSQELYRDVLPRTWPALAVGLPSWGIRAWRTMRAPPGKRGRDALVWLALGFAGLYWIGWISGHTGLGRAISWLILVLQVGAALELAKMAGRLHGALAWACPVAAAAAVVVTVTSGWRDVLAEVSQTPRQVAADILRGVVGEDDVVLSNRGTSLMLPAVTGKVVASPHPLYWVYDHDQRNTDLAAFFRGNSVDQQRATLERYGARWLLLDTSWIKSPELLEQCRGLGTSVKRESRYELLRIDPRIQPDRTAR